MSSTFDPAGSWERVAAELRACKEAQQQAWGDVDSVTLGRYLAGDLSAGEARHLEQVLAERPELRKLTDLVQDVLRDLPPIEDVPPLPAIVPFEPRRRVAGVLAWMRRHASVAAAACLLLVFGMLMPRPGYLSAPRPDRGLDLGRAEAFRAGAAALEDRMVFLDLEAPARDGVRPAIAPPSNDAEPTRPAPKTLPAARGARLMTIRREPRGDTTPPRTPAQLNQLVHRFHVQGDVVAAERVLVDAHRRCEKRFGPKDRTTQWTARQLAGVYQAALNTSDAQPLTPHDLTASAATSYFRAQTSARMVRERITRKPAREVSALIVPVLAHALQTCASSQERQAMARALGNLGPAARPAVPALATCLRQATDPAEQRAVLLALEQMGPAAREALPVLTALTTPPAPAPAVSRILPSAPPSPPGVHLAKIKLQPAEEKLARRVLVRLSGYEGRVGVHDRAGLFCVQRLVDTTRALRHLVRQNEIAVRIETVAGNPAAPLNVEDLGPKALVITLDQTGARVQVRASKALRDEGLAPDRLRAELVRLCKKDEHDKALAVVLAEVKRLAGDGKKR